MRGGDERTESLFSYVSCEARVPSGHPLRPIRGIVDEALEVLSPEFDRLYARIGRPSIPPEKLLRALLWQAFYSVRAARQLMEQLDYNLLFRWFVGLAMDAPIWDVTVFTKNRERLLEGDVAARYIQAEPEEACVEFGISSSLGLLPVRDGKAEVALAVKIDDSCKDVATTGVRVAVSGGEMAPAGDAAFAPSLDLTGGTHRLSLRNLIPGVPVVFQATGLPAGKPPRRAPTVTLPTIDAPERRPPPRATGS